MELIKKLGIKYCTAEQVQAVDGLLEKKRTRAEDVMKQFHIHSEEEKKIVDEYLKAVTT